MATTKYEVTYIIKPDVDEDNKKAVVENYDKVIADNGGTMVESKDWGKRRFAYEIDKYREGTYHIMTFTADNADAVNEFSRVTRDRKSTRLNSSHVSISYAVVCLKKNTQLE